MAELKAVTIMLHHRDGKPFHGFTVWRDKKPSTDEACRIINKYTKEKFSVLKGNRFLGNTTGHVCDNDKLVLG